MIYVFLANGFEELEAFTPIDYLRRCELEAATVGVGGKMITGSHGITTIADMTVFDVDRTQIDMIVLPGGMPGTINLEKSAELQSIIDHCYEQSIPIAAICAAPSILGHKNMLNGRKATCYVGFEDQLIGAEVCDADVVESDNIITARSAGVANEFAFKLVERLISIERCNKLKSSLAWID